MLSYFCSTQQYTICHRGNGFCNRESDLKLHLCRKFLQAVSLAGKNSSKPLATENRLLHITLVLVCRSSIKRVMIPAQSYQTIRISFSFSSSVSAMSISSVLVPRAVLLSAASTLAIALASVESKDTK